MVRVWWPLVLLGAACSSVAWRPRPTEDTWRGASLWSTEGAFLAARSESAAAEVLDAYAQVRAALVANEEELPSAPLILVVEEGDAPLLGEVERTLRQLAEWQRALQPVAPPSEGDAQVEYSTYSKSPDAPPEVLEALLGAAAAHVPLGAPELDLPASWRRVATWGLVMPTDDRMVAAADAVLDFALDKADLSFGSKLLLAPFKPWIRSEARSEVRNHVLRTVAEACCSRAVLGRELSQATQRSILAKLGLEGTASGAGFGGAMAQLGNR